MCSLGGVDPVECEAVSHSGGAEDVNSVKPEAATAPISSSPIVPEGSLAFFLNFLCFFLLFFFFFFFVK